MLTIKKYTKECLTAITSLGTAYFYILILILLILSEKKQAALHLFVGLILAYFLVYVIRIFYFKERPEREEYFNFFTKITASSFPSMHTLSSIFTATVLSNIFKTKSLTIFFYLIALLIAYSRIHIKKHHVTDVLVGLVIGLIFSAIYLSLL